MKAMRACKLCVRGPEPKNLTSSPCKTCGDDLSNFIAQHYLTEEEDRIDIIGQNGNDGLHYEDPVVESVKAKLSARSKAGLFKYGQHLDRTDLSRKQWLIHAQEEAMDLANYLEVLIRNE